MPYKGERPDAPEWFLKAIETPYETGETNVHDTQIQWQRWGDLTKPGLLFLHGNGAHSHWWDFIAPYFSNDYHCIALSLSGMGQSGWRDEYRKEIYIDEVIAVAEATGLFSHSQKPILAAHSFGGLIGRLTLAQHSEKFLHGIIIDSYIPLPSEEFSRPPSNPNRSRIYEDLATALGRFRLAPPQLCENHYILDYIARWSLKKVDGGYTWRFDPRIWGDAHKFVDEAETLRQISCPLTFMMGKDSLFYSPKVFKFLREILGESLPIVSIPHAQHHVWLDQPIAFISALDAVLKLVG